ncbi:MAG: HlyD family efflux transporter periplasmic adaptor subunit [Rivularia sp. ALOHA_DT_140]|nr:HlyD family efflux transporter periplasmic adaptor subunit [Rivularia sp. ALOHA_DT_140]
MLENSLPENIDEDIHEDIHEDIDSIPVEKKDVATLTNYADKKLLEINQLSEVMSTVPSIVQRGGIYLIAATVGFSAVLLYFGKVPVWVDAQGNIVSENENIQVRAKENGIVTEIVAKVGQTLPKNATLLKIKSESLNQNTPSSTSENNLIREKKIKIPQAGRIIKLGVTNPGKFISEGTLLAEVIPAENKFIVEASISEKDFSAIKPGMEAQIKLDAYNHYEYGSLPAKVNRIEPDTKQPGKFIVTLDLLKNNQDKIKVNLPDITLFPGLNVEVEIQTKEQRLYEIIFSQ